MLKKFHIDKKIAVYFLIAIIFLAIFYGAFSIRLGLKGFLLEKFNAKNIIVDLKEVKSIPQNPIPLLPHKCKTQNDSYCCGNNIWEPDTESPITCPQDVNFYFNNKNITIEKYLGDKKISIICLKPCPYTQLTLDEFYLKYNKWYEKIVDFIGFFPPEYQLGIPKQNYKDKYPALTIILGDSNIYNSFQSYFLFPASGGGNKSDHGCPTGMCVSDGSNYVYYDAKNKIFKTLDYKGNIISNNEEPNSEVHEALHSFIPLNYCQDWNHGLIMFLDSLIIFQKTVYSQFDSALNYIYKNKVSINNLPKNELFQLKQSVGNDYTRAVGYIFFTGLYKHYNCKESCMKNILRDWIEQINKGNNICYGNEFVKIIKKYSPTDPTDWIKLINLDYKNGLIKFKSNFSSP